MKKALSFIITGRIISIEMTQPKTNENGEPLPRWYIILFKPLDKRITGQQECIASVERGQLLKVSDIISVKYTEQGFTYSNGKSAKKTGFFFAGKHGDIAESTKQVKGLHALTTAENAFMVAEFSMLGE